MLNSPPLRADDPLLHERPLRVDLGVGLGDDELLLLERGEERSISSVTLPAVDLAVGRLDEPELVDPRVGRRATR